MNNRAALERAISELLQEKQCIRCGTFYSDMDSLGNWGCRVHPGFIQDAGTWVWGSGPGTYSCCGKSPNPKHDSYAGPVLAKGCHRCDHAVAAGRPAALDLPEDQARILFGTRLEGRLGVTHDPDRRLVRVDRYPQPRQ